MKQSKMIRAWLNPEVRATVKDAEGANIGNPAGVSELDETLLGSIGGATNNSCNMTHNSGPTWCLACNQ